MFVFVLLDGLFGIAALILATPLWLDLVIAGIGIALPLIIFWILRRRPTFKPHLFIALILVPLGLPGTHLLARLTKVGVVEIAGTAGIAAIRDTNGVILSLVIIENKVDQGKLFAGQMSDAWISEALSKMAASTIFGARNTAQEVRTLIESGSPVISKELWQHNLATGVTTVRSVDANGKPGAILRLWQDAFIKNRLVDTCRADSLLCDFVDQK